MTQGPAAPDRPATHSIPAQPHAQTDYDAIAEPYSERPSPHVVSHYLP